MTDKTHSADPVGFYAFVANRGSRNITVIDTKKGDIAGLPMIPWSSRLPTCLPRGSSSIA